MFEEKDDVDMHNVQEVDNLIVKSLTASMQSVSINKKSVAIAFCFVVVMLVLVSIFIVGDAKTITIKENDNVYAMLPSNAVAEQKGTISIPSGVVKANPFVPYRKIDEYDVTTVSDVPAFALISPPEGGSNDVEATRIMDTVVSGILYDKSSPSAILCIEGNDYLVKKGDVINGYKVISISENSVVVKLGKNTYSAGIGEVLSDGEVNYNVISNLNNKFGGGK